MPVTPRATQADLFALRDLVRFTHAFSAIEGTMNRGSFAQLPMEIAFVEAVLPREEGPSESSAPGQAAPQPEPPTYFTADPMRAVPGSGRPSRPAQREPIERAPAREVPPPAAAQQSGQRPEPAPIRRAEPRVEPTPSGVSAEANPSLERLVANWTQIRRDVKTANTRIAALLASADPSDIRNNQVVLISPYEFHRNKLNEDNARRIVEDVIARYMGTSLQLVCVDAEDRLAQAPRSVPSASTTTNTSPAANGNGVTHIDPEPEPAPPAPDPLDDPRIRAAKSIFNATELDRDD